MNFEQGDRVLIMAEVAEVKKMRGVEMVRLVIKKREDKPIWVEPSEIIKDE